MIQTVKKTDIGNGRQINQDAYILKEKEYQGMRIMLAAICDGMGGHRRGEVASRYIIEVLKQWFDEKLPLYLKENQLDFFQKELVSLIRTMNRNLLLMSQGADDAMGSTLTVLFLWGKKFLVLNVGDSRAYWFDRNRKFVTKDHTLVQMEVQAGHLTREEARKDPRRHILVQCVGVTKDIQVDCYQGRIKDEMEFILCTDGFYGMLNEEEIYQVHPHKTRMNAWIEDCIEKVKLRGELDNLSCVMVHVS